MSKPKVDLPVGRQGKKIQIPNEVILQLLTPSEIRMLKNRYSIMQLLIDGLSIRSVAREVKVGTDTVVRVAKMAEKENLRKVLKKKLPFKTQTPWIFGKSNE